MGMRESSELRVQIGNFKFEISEERPKLKKEPAGRRRYKKLHFVAAEIFVA